MRTIDDIIPPSRRREADSALNESPRMSQRVSNPPPRFPYATLVVVALIVAGAIGALYYFSSAKVDVTPTVVSAAVQNSFMATQSAGDLPFEIISSEKTASKSVPGSGTKNVTTSASGVITIYNTQSKAQALVTNTRFATTAGLIFRIHAAVTIPAGSTDKPGTITAKVYADKPGEAYNVGPTSFTVPGFAGTSQEGKVYARSTSPMTGGLSGAVPVVSESVESEARGELTSALSADLMADLKSKVPEGYVLLQNAATTTFEALLSTPSSTTGMVDVKEKGSAIGVIFPNAALAKAVAQSIPGLSYGGEPLTLQSTDNLRLSANGLPSADAPSFSFVLTGTASFVYTIDPTRIAAAIAGKTRTAAEVALTNYPEVKRAVIILRPFWRQNFPADPSSISISVLNP